MNESDNYEHTSNCGRQIDDEEIVLTNEMIAELIEISGRKDLPEWAKVIIRWLIDKRHKLDCDCGSLVWLFSSGNSLCNHGCLHIYSSDAGTTDDTSFSIEIADIIQILSEPIRINLSKYGNSIDLTINGKFDNDEASVCFHPDSLEQSRLEFKQFLEQHKRRRERRVHDGNSG